MISNPCRCLSPTDLSPTDQTSSDPQIFLPRPLPQTQLQVWWVWVSQVTAVDCDLQSFESVRGAAQILRSMFADGTLADARG